MPVVPTRPWPGARQMRHTGPRAWKDWRPDDDQNRAYPSRQTVQEGGATSHPEDQIEDAVIAEFAFRPAPGHREVWEDKCAELRLGELNRNWRCGGALCHLAGPDVAS